MHQVAFGYWWKWPVCVFGVFSFFFLRSQFSCTLHCLVGSVHCLRDPQTSFFNKIFIKNRSYDTIHIFKNYFVKVFSVLIFKFSKNMHNSNGPYMNAWNVLITSLDSVTRVKWSINEYIFFIRWCSFLGMTANWIQARFFHIRTRPTGLPRKLGASLFIKRIFFLTQTKLVVHWQASPAVTWFGPKPWPNLPKFFFFDWSLYRGPII